MSQSFALRNDLDHSKEDATLWAQLARLADRAGALAVQRPFLVLTAASVLYFAATGWLAAGKLLWDDEFFSLYISRTNLSGIRAALLTGADQHPPLFYWITHFSLWVFGENPIALRLPAILGFWIMGLGLFRFVSLRTSPLHGYVALLFPAVTGAYYYAYEARGYGPVLGFASLALVCWQQAGESSHRGLATAGLAASLAATVSCHYYSILLLAPLALGEMFRTRERRRIEWRVWAAFTAPALPLLLFVPVIQASRRFAPTFWAHPGWSDVFDAFEVLLRPALLAGTAVASFAVLRLLRTTPPSSPPEPASPALPRHEAVVALGLVAVPLLAIVLAKLVTNAFHLRYVIIVVLGLSIVVPFLTHRLFPTRAATVALLALLAGAFGLRWIHLARSTAGARQGLQSTIQLLAANVEGDLPIAAADVTRFYQLSYYAPPALASRMVYLADPPSAMRHLGHDTVDRCLVALEPWFGVNVEDYTSFVRTRRFLLYDYVGDWSWQTHALTRDGFTPTLLARDGNRLLFRVEPPAPQPPAEAPQPTR